MIQFNQMPSVLASARRGQVMILTILALGGTILGATTIAGLLMLYQIRQATDMANSAKSIFAADAGIEETFYNIFCPEARPARAPCPYEPLGTFGNKAKVTVVCYDESNVSLDCTDPGVRRVRSLGQAGNTARAFEASF